jgi:O-antigen/teichoic acid export membrane protein
VAITLLLNVSLNGLLIPRFGAQGAAIAQATCFIVINMLFMWWANRLIGIRPTAFAGRFW